MSDKCNNCNALSGKDCLVGQSPESCSFYEYQKDVDLAAEPKGNTIIVDDKKSYRRQEKKEKKNTILADNNKYRVKD